MKINQKTLLKNENEVKKFETKESLLEFLKSQTNESIWKRCYVQEVSVVPIQNVPCALKQIREESELSENCPDETVLQCMSQLKVGLRFPYETFEVYPLSVLAYPSLAERSGISGRSLSTIEENGRQKEMAPEDKALIFNKCLPLYKNAKCLVLVRDNMVLAVLSGDENDYSILRADELITCLEMNLEVEFPEYKYLSGKVSQELVISNYALKDPVIERKYINSLMDNGIDVSYANAKLKFITSDIGISSVKLIPFMETDRGSFPIGTPLALSHKHKASISDFDKQCDLIAHLFKSSIEQIEKLAKRKIKYCKGCLTSMAHALGLPKKHSLIIADEVDENANLTAYHIYFYLNEILRIYEAEQKQVNVRTHMRMQEDIAKAIYLKWENFDHPYTWS